ncbi:MAG TPA: GNAT family N-acetyltransferase [Chitinophagaceae bacterium]|nr:GNAT family N-acetyltransferase [Chitinophagaceae bacterium]
MQDTIVFRNATPEDIARIRDIACRTWPATFGKVMPPEQITYMLDLIYNAGSLRQQMTEKGHHFILVEKEGQSLGYASYEAGYAGEPQLMIHKLYLLPETHGMGLGKKTLDHLSGIAGRYGNKALRLKVFYLNDKAIGFYEKYGFCKQGDEVTPIGNGYEILDYVMIKMI